MTYAATMMQTAIIYCVLLMTCALPAFEFNSSPFGQADDKPVTADWSLQLLSERVVPGATADLVAIADIPADWYIYWRNPERCRAGANVELVLAGKLADVGSDLACTADQRAGGDHQPCLWQACGFFLSDADTGERGCRQQCRDQRRHFLI